MTIMQDPGMAPAPPMAPQAGPPVQGNPMGANYQKMMLAQALMGGGGQAAPQSLAGGLAQGMHPALQQMMMQKMMGGAPAAAGDPNHPGLLARLFGGGTPAPAAPTPHLQSAPQMPF